MAHRTTYPVTTAKSEVEILESRMTGAAAADLTAPTRPGEISAGVRTGTGVFNLTFRKKYPQGLVPFSPGIVGTTTGLVAIFTAWAPESGTATVKFSVGGVATDPTATDSIRFAFLVRNSGRNPTSLA